MTITWPRAVALVVALVALVFLIAASGVAPIAASSEHWAVTRWFLNFSMRRAVTTHAIGIEAPPLDDPSLVLRGAGHYEGGCRPCHGAPGDGMPVIPHHMTPHPPNLTEQVPKWEPDQLFWIVKHGIKFTGMPAWPTQEREDEVWAVVAFLQRLPELDERGYAELVHGDETAGVAERCARCHGADGLGRGLGAFPKLAGQTVPYLEASLEAFALGERNSGIMQPIAAALEPAQRRELARYYGDLDPGPGLEAPADAVARGEEIALRGIREEKVGACVHCHGPKEGPRNPMYPELAGQYPEYLALQLRLFQEGSRGGTAWADVMRTVVAHRLEPDQIRDVALYYASLSPASAARAAGD